jgi:hypothetical protein
MDLIRTHVLESIRREPRAPRSVQGRRNAVMIALGFALTGIIALARYGFHRLTLDAPASHHAAWQVVTDGGWSAQPAPIGYVLTLEVAWVVIAVLATWVGFGRGSSMLGRSAATKLAVAALTPVALVLSWLAVALWWLPEILPLAWLEAMNSTQDLGFHTSCAVMCIAYAAGPLLAFFGVRFGRDPVSAREGGAAMSAVAGAWGVVVHFPFCQCTSPLHLALSHVLPVVVLILFGVLVGDLALGVRWTGTLRTPVAE